MRTCYRFSTGLTDAGKKFDTFVGTLIWLNVIAVIAESEPALGNMPGPAGVRLQFFFDTFEVSSSGRREPGLVPGRTNLFS